MILLFAALSVRGRAEESAKPEQRPAAPADASDTTFPAEDPRDNEARAQAKQLGVVMLGGILIIGTALVAFVLIWGNRVRRTAREPLPPVARVNEMWFLRPPKKQGPDDVSTEKPQQDDE